MTCFSPINVIHMCLKEGKCYHARKMSWEEVQDGFENSRRSRKHALEKCCGCGFVLEKTEYFKLKIECVTNLADDICHDKIIKEIKEINASLFAKIKECNIKIINKR